MSSMQTIPTSSDTVFIRGFSTRHHVEDLRNFFTREGGRNTIEFVKETADGDNYLLALKFESKTVAREIINRFDRAEVLGDQITVDWYKDIRKVAGYGYDRSSGSYNRRGGTHQMHGWTADSRYDYRSSAAYRGGRGAGTVPYYGSLRGSGYYAGRATAGSEFTVSRPRRRVPSRSRSRSASRSRSKSASRSSSAGRSDDSHERTQKHRRSVSDSGRKRTHKTKVAVETRESVERSGSSEHSDADSHAAAAAADSSHSKKKKKKKKNETEAKVKETRHSDVEESIEDIKSPADSDVSSRLVLRSTVTSVANNTTRKVVALKPASDLKADADNNDEECSDVTLAVTETVATESPRFARKLTTGHESPPDKSNMTTVSNKLRMSTVVDETDVVEDHCINDDSDIIDEQTQMLIYKKQGKAFPANHPRENMPYDCLSTDYGSESVKQPVSSRDFGALGLSADKMLLVREKKDDIERAYRQDCETFATVTKMLINKDPGIEDRIQFSLRENLKDIGKRCIHELRSFIDGLRADDVDEDCF